MRHFTRPRRNFHVRLACVRHAASVQSEPESNSPVENLWFCLNYIESKQLNSKLIFYSISLFNFQRPVLVSSRSKNLFRSTCMVSTIVPTLKNVLRFSQSARYVYAPFRFRCQELFLFFYFFSKSPFDTRTTKCINALNPRPCQLKSAIFNQLF